MLFVVRISFIHHTRSARAISMGPAAPIRRVIDVSCWGWIRGKRELPVRAWSRSRREGRQKQLADYLDRVRDIISWIPLTGAGLNCSLGRARKGGNETTAFSRVRGHLAGCRGL